MTVNFASKVASAKRHYTALLTELLPATIDINAAIAVFAVESGGQGIDTKYRRPIIRFEVHKFYELYGRNDPGAFNEYFEFSRTGKRWTEHAYRLRTTDNWIKLHTGEQQLEWEALYRAMQLSNESFSPAIQSASWGAPQLMGYHYKRLGYESAHEMMKDAFRIDAQVAMFIRFVLTDVRLSDALATHDWFTFARVYNGSGQVPQYAEWIKSAYDAAVR